MTNKKSLRPQQCRKRTAEGDFPFRFGQDRFDGGEQWRQFGVAPSAVGAHRRAVATVLETVGIARLSAPFAG